jgi:hypothetical protein
MKRLIIFFLTLSLLLVSGHAIASVHGTWNIEKIEKSSLKIGKAKPTIEIVNLADVWTFKDDNSFTSTSLFGAWSQKGSSFTITVDPAQVRALIENEFLSDGQTVTATIKKLRIYGSEKKDWTLKGKYEIKADLVFPDLSTGTLDIKGTFTGTLPYTTSEYYPLNQEDTWTTKSIRQEEGNTQEEIITQYISGTEKIKAVFAVKRMEGDAGSYDLITNSNGIQFYKSYTISDGESTDLYSPAVMYAPPRISVGKRHSFKSTITHKESSGLKLTEKLTGEMVVEGIEDVTVPAGTFEDCFRIRMTRNLIVPKVNYSGYSQYTLWLAKGVGRIKEVGIITGNAGGDISTEEYTDELISATVGGITYRSDYFKPFAQLGSAWTFSKDTIAGVLTFIADTNSPATKGFYMLAMKYNNNSSGGIQTGEYTYDPNTGAYAVTASSIRETNSSFTGFKNQTSDATIAGKDDQLVYGDGGVVQFTATKVTSTTNPLVGSWLNVDTSTNNITVLTFMDNVNYAYAFNVAAGQVDANGGVSGVEFGTYSYSAGTLKKLSVFLDTNGKAGFAELPSAGISVSLSAAGDTITLPARSTSTSPVVLKKVQ